jgi:hydantoinase/carbamoylase family amidase
MRLDDRIAELAEINDETIGTGITREVYTPSYTRSVAVVRTWMTQAGLVTREDAVGNLFGRLEGSEKELPALLTGSHFDTTLDAGRYDGVLGVLGAIEAVERLPARPRRSIEVIGFAGEEPRFGAGCIGSRAMIGALSRADLDHMVDRDGVSVAAAMRSVGLDPDAVGRARIEPAAYCGHLELHIEQGPELEAAGIAVGVVERIAAPHDLRVTLTGMARHAGSTPMGARRDAFTAACEIGLAVERLARGSRSGTAVGTVGVVRVEPGAVNVIPGRVSIDIDIRDSDLAARTEVVDGVLTTIRNVGEHRGVGVEIETTVHDLPAACAPEIVAAVRDACETEAISWQAMISGAYHDAMVLGAELPMGMIFVPSRDGLSHHPDEFTAPEGLELGVCVLTGALRTLTL